MLADQEIQQWLTKLPVIGFGFGGSIYSFMEIKQIPGELCYTIQWICVVVPDKSDQKNCIHKALQTRG